MVKGSEKENDGVTSPESVRIHLSFSTKETDQWQNKQEHMVHNYIGNMHVCWVCNN